VRARATVGHGSSKTRVQDAASVRASGVRTNRRPLGMQSALASRQLARSRPRVVNGSMAPGGLAPAGPLVPLCMHGMGRCLFLLSRSSHRRAARAGGCFPPCSYLLLLAGPPSRCFAFTLSWTLTSTAKCSRVPLLPSGWLGCYSRLLH
jgi:hypothetical protein